MHAAPPLFPGLSGAYSQPVQLDPSARLYPTSVSVSQNGTVRLEQNGKSVLLTPTELRALADLADRL